MENAILLFGAQAGTFSRGIAIAGAGLLIVFVALLLISLFIAALPRVLSGLARIWPEAEERTAIQAHSESFPADDAHILAAIGFVLHTELQRQLAEEQSSKRPLDKSSR